MDEYQVDLSRELMLDGNALGGLLQEIFGGEATAAPAECAHCGSVSEVGRLLAFTHGPGAVLRCPACEQIMLRVVQTPTDIFLDARGAAVVRIARGRA